MNKEGKPVSAGLTAGELVNTERYMDKFKSMVANIQQEWIKKAKKKKNKKKNNKEKKTKNHNVLCNDESG